MSISEFVQACDAYGSTAGISRATVSNKLFGSHRKIDQLASGAGDIGVKRFERACRELAVLVAGGTLDGTADTADPPPSPVEV